MCDYQCTGVSFIKLSNRIELFFPECSTQLGARSKFSVVFGHRAVSDCVSYLAD